MPASFAKRLEIWTPLVLVLWVAVSYADEPKKPAERKRPDALDIVPEEALVAVAIRNVSELIKRGDTFIDKTEFNTPMRLSAGYAFLTGYLGVSKGLDEQGSAALFVISTKADLKLNDLVMAIPVGDLKEMATNFHTTPENMPDGRIIDRQERELGRSAPADHARYVSRRGGHVLLGSNEPSLRAAAKSKVLRDVLPKEDVQSLAQDDILFYANPRPIKDDWKGVFGPLNGAGQEMSPDEAAALQLVAEASQDLEYAAAGLRLDGGLGATALLRFKGEKSREILTRLQGGGQGPTSLAGLPVGRVLAAYAAQGDGERSASVARALLHYTLANYVADTREIISAGHRPNVVGVFGEIWQRLEGSRSALYENEDPDRDGHFSLVAVLDTQDASKFISDMTGLARFVNAAGLALDDQAEAIDAKTIAALVAELGHDEYRVRQTATTKLGLVGKPALPALEKAVASQDAEVQFRAQAIKGQILLLAAEEREDLLKRDLLSRIQPKFAFFPQVESRSGRPVDVVQLRLGLDEAPHAAELRRLLGPDWRKIRLASVGKRVIVLLGSNTELLDQAIGNLQSEKQGLHDDDRIAAFRARSSTSQSLELHLTLSRAAELVSPAGEPKPAKPGPAPISSIGLSLSPERVRLDLYSPFEEVKGVTKKLGW